MKLQDHFAHSGNVFFRLRSYLPLLLLPAFVLSARAGAHVPVAWRVPSEVTGFVVSMLGFVIRVATIGTAPPGTSGRGTRDPYAAVLNTMGVYSVVRHPLYLGNTLMALGFAVFTATWFLPAIVVLASLLYHERICVREEVFLESRFGDQFRSWAANVPALVPSLRRYRAPEGRFQWQKVLAREFHALFVIGSGFFFLDVVRHLFAGDGLTASPAWLAVFAITAAIFAVLLVLKKWTGLLRPHEPTGESHAGA